MIKMEQLKYLINPEEQEEKSKIKEEPNMVKKKILVIGLNVLKIKIVPLA